MIRSQLSRVRNRDAVIGEEFGSSGSGSRKWVIDPIDGTKNFVRGVPCGPRSSSLVEDDQVVAGVVSAPALLTPQCVDPLLGSAYRTLLVASHPAWLPCVREPSGSASSPTRR